MMRKDDNILSKLPRHDGMTVPDGYFADFSRRMQDALPPRPELAQMAAAEIPRTRWQQMRPYVYMAAMFAGVWLMLQMFTMMTGANRLQPMDSNPVLAEALMNDDFMDNYIYNDVDDWELVDQMIEDGSLNTDEPFDFEDFTAITPDSETEPADVILPQ